MIKPVFRLWVFILRSTALLAGFLGAFHLPVFAQQKTEPSPEASTAVSLDEKKPALETAAAVVTAQPAAAAVPSIKLSDEASPAAQTPPVQAAETAKAPESVLQPAEALPPAADQPSEKEPQTKVVVGSAPAVEQSLGAVQPPEALELSPAIPPAQESQAAPIAASIAAPAADTIEPAQSSKPPIVVPAGTEVFTLGPVPGSVLDRTGLDIAGVGLTSSHIPFITQRPKETVESRNEFPSETSQIFWFAFFQGGRTHEEKMRRPKFSVEWFAPSGQKVYYGTFRANIAYPEHVRTRLPLNTLGMQDVSGRWRVRVTSGDQLVDERHFMIAKPEVF